MQQEQFDGDKELVEEADFVLAEICSSSLKEEEEVMRTLIYDNSSRVTSFTRSGRRATWFLL